MCALMMFVQRERHVNTASGGMYSGAESVAPVCTLALTHSADQLLSNAVNPYVQLLKLYRGRATFQLEHSHSASSNATSAASTTTTTTSTTTTTTASTTAVSSTTATATASPSPRVLVDVQLPASLLDYRVLLLVPQLDAQSYPELLSLLTHLQGCGCELAALTVCCITAARPALWSVMSVYPTLALISTAIDEVRHGQLIPGIRQLDSRSAVQRSHTTNSQQSDRDTGSSSSEAGNTVQSDTARPDVFSADNERSLQADVS